MSERTQVWSCGGGVQSAAIAALIVQGRLLKPDLSVIVDTEHEKSSTWQYLETTLRPALASVGVEIERVNSSAYRTVGLFSADGESLLVPAFTNISGEVSKLPAYCSNEWKQRVAHRWMRAKGITEADVWLGISRDEMSRVRAAREKWVQARYPLIFEVPMRREDCIALIAEMGWPDAPRSSCSICPNMRDREWREMRDISPEDFAHAVQVDKAIRERDPHAFLHESCIPLDEVDFTNYQTSFTDNGCASGYCWS